MARDMAPIRAVVTDIEGTTTPIAFVHQKLFPFSRERLARFCKAHAQEPQVAKALQDTRDLADKGHLDLDGVIALLDQWIQEDRKAGPLKTLQGLIWREGYEEGLLAGELYADAAEYLRRWHAAGLDLYVYSSGSEEAQRLIFGHSDQGDLAILFRGFFDTRMGAKVEAKSYSNISAAIGVIPAEILFLTDAPAEVVAAREAGLQVVRIDRALPLDALNEEAGGWVAGSFACVERIYPLKA